MNEFCFLPEADDKGKRLDIYLSEQLARDYTRSQIKRFIEKGFVEVSGKVKKPNYQIKEKDSIKIILSRPEAKVILPEKIPLDIVYEDTDIIVLDKPSGMVVHPGAGNAKHTLVNALMFHAKQGLARIDSNRPGIVHRLDKEVSGLMVVAKTDSAYSSLVDAFKKKTIHKTYIAFVEGILTQDRGCLELPIGRSTRDRKKMAVKFFNSKQALTDFRVLKRLEGFTKLQLNIHTGRTHQIRVHMSYMGHPIMGDVKYGARPFRGIALYSAGLGFNHPRTGKRICFGINIPNHLKDLDAQAKT
jgi:23S rRNA pseudouridine1911/1915/1917 synthase